MSTYLISGQEDPRRCGNCGAPLVGRFSPCLSCQTFAVEGSGAHAGPVSGLPVAQHASAQTFPPKRPARKMWHRSPDELVYPYESIDEDELVARANRRSRAPLVLAASVLAVSSAVYLGFVHGDGAREGAPVVATGNVSAQNGEASVDVAAPRGGVGVTVRPGVVAQRSASGATSGVTSVVTPGTVSSSGQRSGALVAQDSGRVSAEQAIGAADRSRADAMKARSQPQSQPQSSAVARQPSAGVAQHLASIQSSAVTPPAASPAASPSGQRPAVVATVASTQPSADLPVSATDKSRGAPTTLQSPSGVTAQQQPVAAAQRTVQIQPSATTRLAASPAESQHVAMVTPGLGHAFTNPAISATNTLRVDTSKSQLQPQPQLQSQSQSPQLQSQSQPQPPQRPQTPSQSQPQPRIVAQRPPVVVAQPILSGRTAPTTSPAATTSEQHRVVLATQTPDRASAEQPSIAADKPHADALKSAPQAQQRVIAQQQVAAIAHRQPPLIAQPQPQPVIVAQRTAPLQSSPAPTSTSPLQRHAALTTPDAQRAAADQPMSAADKQRADSSRYLKAARVNLKANNLSATKARLAAAIAAQPDNRDALRMRSTVRTLEQQRDAILNLARGCGYIGHWACMSHNAGIALQIDSSSKEAQRLVNLGAHESALQVEPQAADTVEAPLPVARYVIAHH